MSTATLGEDPASHYARYCRAIANRSLPLSLVDLDALDTNVTTVRAALGGPGAQVRLRIASKSVRSVHLLRTLVDAFGERACGVMTYSAPETAFLAAQGFADLLLAYPTTQRHELAKIAVANRKGVHATVVADAKEHLEALDAAAREAGTRMGAIVDIDVSYRPLPGVTLGVRRSPLRSLQDVLAFVEVLGGYAHLYFAGLLAYEAQLAGVPDHDSTSSLPDAAVAAMKALSQRDVARRRREIVEALRSRGLAPPLVNGGGTGSLAFSLQDASLTEVTVGSAFLASHLFDHYRGLRLVPAAYFALEVVRRPSPRVVTCHGGGFVASGAAGPSRLPIPALPLGLSLRSMEGAGEVQTPLTVAEGVNVALGDPVFFRHAKTGELAEHFEEYALVRGQTVEGVARTYRGLGHSFLG